MMGVGGGVIPGRSWGICSGNTARGGEKFGVVDGVCADYLGG